MKLESVGIDPKHIGYISNHVSAELFDPFHSRTHYELFSKFKQKQIKKENYRRPSPGRYSNRKHKSNSQPTIDHQQLLTNQENIFFLFT